MKRRFVIQSISKGVVRGVFMPEEDQTDIDRGPSGLHNFGQCEFVATKEELKDLEEGHEYEMSFDATAGEEVDTDEETIPPVQSTTAAAQPVKP